MTREMALAESFIRARYTTPADALIARCVKWEAQWEASSIVHLHHVAGGAAVYSDREENV